MLKAKIKDEKPDFGVCFDGDADRCFFVDEGGKTVGCDMVTALLARDFLSMPQNKGATIVYDLRSSHVVADEIKAAGGVPKRERVGHAFIKKTLAETKAVFGGSFRGNSFFGTTSSPIAGGSPFRAFCPVVRIKWGRWRAWIIRCPA